MKILLTGNLGYAGSVLTGLLRQKGHTVIGYDTNYYDGCEFFLSPPAPHVQIKKDIRDVSRDDLALADAVIHLAALSNDPLSMLSPERTEDINFRATVRLAKLAKDAGIKRFVFASSCSMYGIAGEEVSEDSPLAPLTPYAVSKVNAEKELSRMADENFSPVFLRPGTAYGVSPMMRFDLVVNNLVGWAYTTGKIKIMSDGTPWRPVIHVEDFAAGFIAALEAPKELVRNQAFNLGKNEENYQIRDIASAVKEIIPGCELEYTKEHGVDTRTYRVNFDKIRTTMQDFWQPTWTLKDGIKQLYDFFREHKLSYEDFIGSKYTRLKRIQELVRENKLDERLFWQWQT